MLTTPAALPEPQARPWPQTMLSTLPVAWLRTTSCGRILDRSIPDFLAERLRPGVLMGDRLDAYLRREALTCWRRAAAMAEQTGRVQRLEFQLPGVDGPRVLACQVSVDGQSVCTAMTDVTVGRGGAPTNARFAATMSHELRTPISGIVGMAELLEHTPLDEEQRSYVQMLASSGRQLLSLVNNVLDFAKIEAGRLTLESIPYSPREVAESAMGMVAEAGNNKGLELSTWVDHDVPRVVIGDPYRLRQVLLNFLSNAVKFTDTGEVSLRVRLGCPGPRGGARVGVDFSVADTGIGVAPEVAESVFRPFVQADASTTRRFGGTGLGLAISERIAELLGGRISLKSAVDQGSAFTLHLPVALPQDLPASVRPLAYDLQGRFERALVITERPRLAAILVHELSWLGMTVDHLPRSMADAIDPQSRQTSAERAPASPYDIIFVAASGPRGASVDFMRQLRQDPRLSGTRVVAITRFGVRPKETLADDVDRQGFDALLTSPISQAALHHSLRLARQRPRAPQNAA